MAGYKQVVAVFVAVVASAVLMVSGAPQAFTFATDAETYLDAPLVEGWTCDGRRYGYYADPLNNCQVFHICLPRISADGLEEKVEQWSFICGNGTIFDQETLTCNYKEFSLPCDQAESFYNAIEFGREDDPVQL